MMLTAVVCTHKSLDRDPETKAIEYSAVFHLPGLKQGAAINTIFGL